MPGEAIDCTSRLNATDLILGPALADGRHQDTALVCGETAVAFGELDSWCNRVSNALAARTTVGDRVLMLLKDSPLFVAAFLGIMRGGRVAVPLNTRLAPRDLAYVLQHSEAAAVLVDADFLPVYREATAIASWSPAHVAVHRLAGAGFDSLDQWIDGETPHAESRAMSADEMAFWLYSSGTTGTPKAVIHTHGCVSAGDAYMRALGLAPGERVFASSKLFFAFALGHTVLGGLRAGATVILCQDWPDPARVADIVERHRPSVMLSVPTMLRNLLRDGFADRAGFRSVRIYLSAGEALPAGLYERWLAQTGVPVIEGIGASETIFMFISGMLADHRPGATGKPVSYAQVRLLDRFDRPITDPDVPGTAWVKMPSLCRGYWKEPEKTLAAFRDEWFCTGDTFSVDSDGWWYHQGRSDDLLKISGQWVSPAEIEQVATAVPGVLEAAVVGVENSDGLVRMTLFVVTAADIPEGTLARTRLKEAITQTLSSTLSIYKCPRDIRFIEEVPRTATGKAQRFLLRRVALQENARCET
ncbi:MAG: benzoate-CoA ligase family protein [Acidobacteria bacterium]|nr:benzoate-CoA ligase family protein [Acidobacteriota bacterium]MEB2350035.1 benzoate-CoA ligase family protein [Burkholderiaceae bacterium]